MMSLAEIAYYNCPVEHKLWYDTEPNNVVHIDLHDCCTFIMERRRAKGTVAVDPIVIQNALEEAVWEGHTDCMRALHVICISTVGMPMDSAIICALAAYSNHLDCLEYAHANGYQWDVRTTTGAICMGNLDALRFARDRGCPISDTACTDAAYHGRLNCLRYLHEAGYPWDAHTTSLAAIRNELECLTYAHQNGCEMNNYTTWFAARVGSLQCLQYAHVNGCEWDWCTTHAAITHGHYDCYRYAVENGCELRRPPVLYYVPPPGDE